MRRNSARSCRRAGTASIRIRPNIDADGAALLVPAELSPQQARRLQELAVEVFRLLGCAGLARVDFFVKADDMFVNEVNTLPGFTSISMYPSFGKPADCPKPISWTG
jgi:D-alanine-D-alanine ligase